MIHHSICTTPENQIQKIEFNELDYSKISNEIIREDELSKKDKLLQIIKEEKFIKEESVKAFIGISLKTGKFGYKDEEEIGIMYIDFRHPHYFYDEELNFIQLFSQQLSSVIQNARLYEKLRIQKTSQVKAINEITRSISDPFELKRILNGILGWTRTLMGEASLIEIRLLDKETNMLVASESIGENIKEEFIKVPVGKGITVMIIYLVSFLQG